MKKVIHFSKAQSFLVVALVMVQSIEAVNPNRMRLQNYFKSLQRGVTCLIKRTPCAPEDKDAVWTAGKIVGLLVVMIGMKIGYSTWKLSKDMVQRPYPRPWPAVESWFRGVAAELLAAAIETDDIRMFDLIAMGVSLHDLPPNMRVKEDRLRQKMFTNATNNAERKLALNLGQQKPLVINKDKVLELYYKYVDIGFKGALEKKFDKDTIISWIKIGANVNSRVLNHQPLLYSALFKQDWQLAKELIRQGANPELIISPSDRRTIRQAFPKEITQLEKDLAYSIKL